MSDHGSSSGEGYDPRPFFDLSLDMLCIAGPDGRFRMVNPAFKRSLGYVTADLKGEMFGDRIHPNDAHIAKREFKKMTSGETMVSFECRYRRLDDAYRHLLWVWVLEPRSKTLYGIARDLTDITVLETRLLKMSRMDPLTGVATRQVFDESLETEWNRARRMGSPLAVALVEVDDFAFYRDKHGHVSAEECLKTIASLLPKHARRAGDLVSRIDDACFGLIWGNVDAKTANTLCERIRKEIEVLELRLRGKGGVGRVTVTIGASTFLPGQGREAESLLTAAGTSLYEAQNGGPNRCVVKQLM
jgi:diguanylate cyclase (GGDEF)-like protein/PAS domain S-box-containing protein